MCSKAKKNENNEQLLKQEAKVHKEKKKCGCCAWLGKLFKCKQGSTGNDEAHDDNKSLESDPAENANENAEQSTSQGTESATGGSTDNLENLPPAKIGDEEAESANEPTPENPKHEGTEADDEQKESENNLAETVKKNEKLIYVCVETINGLQAAVKEMADKLKTILQKINAQGSDIPTSGEIQCNDHADVLTNIEGKLQGIETVIAHIEDCQTQNIEYVKEKEYELEKKICGISNTAKASERHISEKIDEMKECMLTNLDRIEKLSADFSQGYEKWWYKVGTRAYGMLGDIKKAVKSAIEDDDAEISMNTHKDILTMIEDFTKQVSESNPRGRGDKND